MHSKFTLEIIKFYIFTCDYTYTHTHTCIHTQTHIHKCIHFFLGLFLHNLKTHTQTHT